MLFYIYIHSCKIFSSPDLTKINIYLHVGNNVDCNSGHSSQGLQGRTTALLHKQKKLNTFCFHFLRLLKKIYVAKGQSVMCVKLFSNAIAP